MNELTHAEVVERLSPYLDDELDPITSAAIDAHLARCAECARAAERLRTLSAAVDGGLERHVAPAGLRARIEAALPTPETRRPQQPRRVPAAWRTLAMAAGFVIVAGLGWIGVVQGPARTRDRLATEVVSSHVRSLMANHLTDVTSTDQHTVKPWFDGRLDFAPPVTDLADRGFPLVGGRLDYVGGRSVAALVYRRRLHVINLFLWPRASQEAPASMTRQGYHVVHGAGNGVEYWAVSDLNPSELESFVAALGLRQ